MDRVTPVALQVSRKKDSVYSKQYICLILTPRMTLKSESQIADIFGI